MKPNFTPLQRQPEMLAAIAAADEIENELLRVRLEIEQLTALPAGQREGSLLERALRLARGGHINDQDDGQIDERMAGLVRRRDALDAGWAAARAAVGETQARLTNDFLLSRRPQVLAALDRLLDAERAVMGAVAEIEAVDAEAAVLGYSLRVASPAILCAGLTRQAMSSFVPYVKDRREELADALDPDIDKKTVKVRALCDVGELSPGKTGTLPLREARALARANRVEFIS